MIRLGSLFDGIGSWQLAAVRNDIIPLWSSEIDPFCCSVTKRHFPATIQLGDIRNFTAPPSVDIVTAGFPCQDLSVAGKRQGLFAERSGLFFDSIKIIRRIKPCFAVFENVTGLLTSNKGLDFKALLEEITETAIPLPECKWSNAGLVDGSSCQVAWRILDSQFFGVPQRRRRVFIVADFTGRRAAKILFESHCLQRHYSPRTQQGQANTPPPRVASAETCYGLGRDFFNQGTNGKFGLSLCEELQPPLTARGAGAVFDGYVVRRLTPVESERLMGLPDDWTAGASDTARYRVIGNGMAQPVADWILHNIAVYFYD